jgi:hypothetical protein
MESGAFIAMLSAFGIVPIFVSVQEARSIFNASTATNGLSAAEFNEALGRFALVALSRENTQFPKLYPRAEDKVKVLLELWGLGDPAKLASVRAAAASS